MVKFGTLPRCAVTFLLSFVLTGASTRPQEYSLSTATGNGVYAALTDCKAVEAGHGALKQRDNCIFVGGYIMGVYDVLRVTGRVSDSNIRTITQINDTVHLYLAAHPEQRDMHGVVVVIAALTKAYPPQ